MTSEVRVTNEYYNRIIVVEFISVLLTTFGIGLSIVLNEIKLTQ